MQWLITLETEEGLIMTCRIMNVFRRKGLKIVTLVMKARPSGYSMIAVIESPEADANHVFNLLRRTEGIQHIFCYKRKISASLAANILKALPESKLIFDNHGKYLLEAPADGVTVTPPAPK